MSGTGPSEAAPQNPLEQVHGVPPFGSIRGEHVEPAVERMLAAQRATIREIVTVPATASGSASLSWLEELERMHEALHRLWGPVAHLNAVASNPALREAYNRCVPRIAEFSTEVSQDRGLYE
jgi:oligopeptidase A